MDPLESNRRELGQFFGHVHENSISAYDAPWGSFTELVNLNGNVPGEIRTRKGYAPCNFTHPSAPSDYDIISVAGYSSGLGPTALTVDTFGRLIARRNSTTFEVATGLQTSAPWRFCTTRDNRVIAVNGLSRGLLWRGEFSVAVELGVDPPTAAIADADIVMGSGGGASEGTYLVCQRFVDKETHRTDYAYSEMSPVRSKSATAGQKFTYDSSDLEDPPGRGQWRQYFRTSVGQSSVLYFITEQAITETADYDDVFTDQQLIDAAADDSSKVIPIRGRYGIVARRQTPPPTTKSSVIMWRDRAWYGVDGVYDTGTVSVTNGDATLTGSGTAFVETFVGRYVYIDGAALPYKVLSFTNATSMELTPTPAASLSGKTYKILPDPAERNQLLYSSIDEPESVHPTFAITIQTVPEDSGDVQAMMPMGGSLIVFTDNHAYSLTYSKEPNYDGSVQHAFSRGCLNQGCFDSYDGQHFVMDRNGAYIVGPGGGVEPISEVIQSYWRDGTIDFADAKWFHVNVDPSDKVARFFVNFTADTATRPCRALCYHVLHKTWSVEYWPNEWAGCVRFEIDGHPKTVVGGLADRLYFLGDGELDGVSAEQSGTATAATASTLTNSGASFGGASQLVGASVAIYDGTGFGQARRITSHTGTALTVSPNWTTTPDTTSKYVVGGMSYVAKCAFQPIISQARKEQEVKSLHLAVRPIVRDRPIHVRETWDFDSTAQTYSSEWPSPDGLTVTSAGGTDREISIHSTALINEAGVGQNRGYFTLFDYSRDPSSRLQGKRSVSVELEGVKSDEALIIHELAISGTGK